MNNNPQLAAAELLLLLFVMAVQRKLARYEHSRGCVGARLSLSVLTIACASSWTSLSHSCCCCVAVVVAGWLWTKPDGMVYGMMA